MEASVDAGIGHGVLGGGIEAATAVDEEAAGEFAAVLGKY